MSPSADAQDAPDKAACMSAYTDGQKLRKDGALLDAREQLRTCADPACPKLVVSDCTSWLEEVDGALPTVVIAVRDGNGDDVIDAEIVVDGEVRARSVDGQPLELDPGPHTITVRRGDDSVDKKLVARASDKDRVVELTLGAASSAPAPPTTATDPDQAEGGAGLLIAGGILAGLGAAGLGVFAGLGAVGSGEASDLNDGCAVTDTCTEDEIDAVQSKLVGADIALAAGATLLAIGVTLIIVDVAGGEGEGDADARLELRVQGRPGGGFGMAQLRF